MLGKLHTVSLDVFGNQLFCFSRHGEGDRLFCFINQSVGSSSTEESEEEPEASSEDGQPHPSEDPLELFPSADAAYDYLLGKIDDRRKAVGQGDALPEKATLIQYVCHHSQSLIKKLLENEKAVVNVFVQHEKVPHLLGIRYQTEKLRRRQLEFKDLFGDRQPTNVYDYDVPASLSAVCLYDEWIMLGWYTYEPVEEQARPHQVPGAQPPCSRDT